MSKVKLKIELSEDNIKTEIIEVLLSKENVAVISRDIIIMSQLIETVDMTDNMTKAEDLNKLN